MKRYFEISVPRPWFRIVLLVCGLCFVLLQSYIQKLGDTDGVPKTADTHHIPTPLYFDPLSITDENSDSDKVARYYSHRFRTVHDIQRLQMKIQNTSARTNLIKLARQMHIINCSNVHEIKITRLLRRNIHKSTYEAVFRGTKVAVVVYNIRNMNMCIKRSIQSLQDGSLAEIAKVLYSTRCEFLPGDSFVYEIMNHAVLDFPNTVKNLGYCIRDTQHTDDDADILLHNTVVVFEYGDPVCFHTLASLPWLDRVKHCRDLANLLELSENSLLGSIAFTDIREKHLVMAANKIKFKDLDLFVTSVEPKCGPKDEIPPSEQSKLRRIDNYQFNCSYGLPCVHGVCNGTNARENLQSFTEIFFSVMLDVRTIPSKYSEMMKQFLKDLADFKLSPSKIKAVFETILKDERMAEEPLEYPVYFIL